jgi:hypothetical protein
MKKIITIFVIFINFIYAYQTVYYLKDSITQKDDRYIKLLGGTSWELTEPSLALVTDDIIIIFYNYKGKTLPMYYYDGEEIPIRYISGKIYPNIGYLTTVINKSNDGSILETSDNLLLTIPQFYRYDTSFWLTPYQILIENNQMYFWNLEKGKRIEIDRIYQK